MQIAIIALGSRGDIQPYIALGKGLKSVGYAVKIITHENYESLVTSYGLEFCLVKGDVQEFMAKPETRELLEKGNFLAINAYASKAAQRAAIDWAEGGLAACQNVDLLIAGVGGLFLTFSLAEKMNIPLIQAYVFPFTPTSAFPAVLFPEFVSRFGGVVNQLSHHLFRQIMWQSSRKGDTMARKQVLGLPTAPFFGSYNSKRFRKYPKLYGFSSSIIPQPKDWKNTYVTGYWFLDEAPDWIPPSRVADFLQNGDRPVFVGFGSMGSRNPEETANIVVDAIKLTGKRAIIQSGWNGLQNNNLPDNILMVDSIPHAWLFDRVAAVVHHGGAGTTAAGIRAGVPTVIVPFFGDQTYWGLRMAKLGVGSKPIPRKKLTAQGLAVAISSVVNDQSIRQNAAELGAKVRCENGVANAVAIIQELDRKGAFVR